MESNTFKFIVILLGQVIIISVFNYTDDEYFIIEIKNVKRKKISRRAVEKLFNGLSTESTINPSINLYSVPYPTINVFI